MTVRSLITLLCALFLASFLAIAAVLGTLRVVSRDGGEVAGSGPTVVNR